MKKQKKQYEVCRVELICLGFEDIITSSGEDLDPNQGEWL